MKTKSVILFSLLSIGFAFSQDLLRDTTNTYGDRIDTAAERTSFKTNLELENVDNTSDVDKPISTLIQAALDLKAPLLSPPFIGTPTINGLSAETTTGSQTKADAAQAAAESTANVALGVETTARILSDDKTSRSDQILKEQRNIISNRQGATPAKLRVLSLGDSFGGMSELANALSGKYHYVGRGLAALEAVYAGGAAALTNYTLWPATMHTLPSGGSVTFGVGAFGSLNYPIFTDNVRAFYIAESGAGTFKLQVEYNLSGSWIDATGIINADNAASPVGTVVSTGLPGPTGVVRMRAVGLSGTVKIVGGDIALQTSNPAYPHVNYYDLSESGSLISQQLNASSAVVTPILTAISPDLVTWCADDGAAEITTNLPTLITQINTRSASTPDWAIVSTHPTGTGSQVGVQAAAEAARTVANASGYAFVNLFDYFGGDTPEMIAKGLLNVDNYHLSYIGGRIAQAEIVRVTGLANNYPRGGNAYLPEQVVGVSQSFHTTGATWRVWSDVQTDRRLDLSPINGYGYDKTSITAYKNNDVNLWSAMVFEVGSATVASIRANGQMLLHKGADFTRATRAASAKFEIAGSASETQFKIDAASGLSQPLVDLRVNGSQKVLFDSNGNGSFPTIKTSTFTFATLPVTGIVAGSECYISDGSVVHAGNSGNVAAGGGANFTPVYYDGSNWRIR